MCWRAICPRGQFVWEGDLSWRASWHVIFPGFLWNVNKTMTYPELLRSDVRTLLPPPSLSPSELDNSRTLKMSPAFLCLNRLSSPSSTDFDSTTFSEFWFDLSAGSQFSVLGILFSLLVSGLSQGSLECFDALGRDPSSSLLKEVRCGH